MAKSRNPVKLALTVTVTEEIKADIENYLKEHPEFTQRSVIIMALRGFFKQQNAVEA